MLSAIEFIFLCSHIALVLVGKASTHSCLTKYELKCRWGWQLWSDACYALTQRELNWIESREECGLLGGQMMVPQTLEENAFVSSLIETDHWIDCNDIDTENQFVCEGIAGPTYTNWQDGEPSDSGSVQRDGNWGPADCVRITPDGFWRDDSCEFVFFFAICKRDAAVVDVSSQLQSWRLLASCLVGHVIYEFQTGSMNACAVECSNMPGCLSFNVHHHQAKKICQLNNATRHDARMTDFIKISKPLCMYGER